MSQNPVIESVLDERMFACIFSFMKSSLASSRSICASIAAANCGLALWKEKSRSSILIFWTGGRMVLFREICLFEHRGTV
jgi:hypothetical protein